VSECISYISDNFGKVAALPLDMSSLSDELLGKLSKVVDEEKLEALWVKCSVEENTAEDRQCLALVNKLYKNKLETELRAAQTTLVRCEHCQRLYPAQERASLTCTAAEAVVDYRGSITAQHVPEPRWRFQKHLASLRKGGSSWREIFWLVWGHLHVLSCLRCGSRFLACDIGHCLYHPQPPSFPPTRSHGVFPCCGGSAFRFDTTSTSRQGCAARNHEVDTSNGGGGATDVGTERVLHLLSMYGGLIAVPWASSIKGKSSAGDAGDDEDRAAQDLGSPHSEQENGHRRWPHQQRRRLPPTASARGVRTPSRGRVAAASVAAKAAEGAESDAAAGSSCSDATASGSDTDDALGSDDEAAKTLPCASETPAKEGSAPGEAVGTPRSFLSLIGPGRYTASIKKVTENSSNRVKAALQAAMFQELIRQDDADRMEMLMEQLAAGRDNPALRTQREARARTAAPSRGSPRPGPRPVSASAARTAARSLARQQAFR